MKFSSDGALQTLPVRIHASIHDAKTAEQEVTTGNDRYDCFRSSGPSAPSTAYVSQALPEPITERKSVEKVSPCVVCGLCRRKSHE